MVHRELVEVTLKLIQDAGYQVEHLLTGITLGRHDD